MKKQEHKHRPNKISCSRAYCTLQSTRCTFLRLTSACSYSYCCCWYLQYHCIMYKYLLLNTPPSFITRNGNETMKRRKFPHSWTCCNLSTVDDARPSVRPSVLPSSGLVEIIIILCSLLIRLIRAIERENRERGTGSISRSFVGLITVITSQYLTPNLHNRIDGYRRVIAFVSGQIFTRPSIDY